MAIHKIPGMVEFTDLSGETYDYVDYGNAITSWKTGVNEPVTFTATLEKDGVSRLIQDKTFSIQQNMAYDIDQNILDKIFQEMASRFNKVPIVKHKCHGCGATVEMDADRHLFTCAYCGSAYAIGTAQIWS